MRRINCRIIACLACICIMTGCSSQGESKQSESTELPSSTTTNAEEIRDADIPIDTDSVSLSDLSSDFDQSFILIDSNAECGSIYRLCIEDDSLGTNAVRAYIEYYETEKISADFLSGEDVRVLCAYKNIINISDYHIFAIRFNMLNTIEISELKKDNIDCQRYLVCPETARAFDLTNARCGENAGDVESDDKGLLEFMHLMFLDRGIGKHGKQHF